MRAPPQRVMQDRLERDAAHEARTLEENIKAVGKAQFEHQRRQEQQDAAAALEKELAMRRKAPVPDPQSLQVLQRVLHPTATASPPSPIPKDQTGHVSFDASAWQSPVKRTATPSLKSGSPTPAVQSGGAVSASAPLISVRTTLVDHASSNQFLKSIGVWNSNRVANTTGSNPSPARSTQTLMSGLSHSPSAVSPTPLQAKAVMRSAASMSHVAPSIPPMRRDRDPEENAVAIDHSRAPMRTLVGHIPAIRNLMKTKPLAPLQKLPPRTDTAVPEEGTNVNTETMLSKFKLLQAEERDFVVDEQSRLLAEEHDGTLLHYEMTSSMRRVEAIVSALDTGKPYRDFVTYREKKSDPDADNSNSGNDAASTEELRAIIHILLQDSAKQGSVHQEMELQFRKVQAELKEAQEDIVAKQATILSLQKQVDQLLAEGETLRKKYAHLEQQYEKMVASSEAAILEARRAGEHNRTPQHLSLQLSGDVNTPASSELNSSMRESKTRADAVTLLRGLSAVALPSMDAIPHGDDVTIVCTAVQSIASLWEHCPAEMPTALMLHNRVLQQEIPRHHGYQVKTAGEEFMVAFKTTVDAVNFAVAMQEILVQQTWPQHLGTLACCGVVPKESPDDDPSSPSAGDLWRGLRVSMGIHCGAVHVDFNPSTGGFDYMGPTVNRALLLKRVAHGGMAAVSREVYDRLSTEMDRQALLGGVGPTGAQSRRIGHSVSYGESLRKRSSGRNLRELAAQQPAADLSLITTAFLCKIPGVRQAAMDVFCVLPLSLEDRLVDIHAANKAMAESHGLNLEDVLQPTTEDEQPSELEKMLGTFSRKEKQLILTGSGVEEAPTKSDDEIEAIALQQANLPSGLVTMLTIQSDVVRNKKFIEKILAKDMEHILASFHDCIELAAAPFHAKLVERRKDVHTYAFSNIGVAVRCALAIDAELTTYAWPKWIENYKELEEVTWNKGVRIFAGLRPQMGLHQAQLKPWYDSMKRTVGYVGFDAFVAPRLATAAKPGQLLMDETNAYHALALVRPMPFYSHLTPSASSVSNSSISARLCVVISRSYVGRHFVWAGVDRYEAWKSPSYRSQYKRMMMDLEMEDTRWRRDATRVVAKEHVNSGIIAPVTDTKPTSGEGEPSQDGGTDELGADAASLMGLGQQFEAVVQKAAGTVNHATETRKRDCEVTNIFITTLLEKMNAEGLSDILRDREPTVGQLEKLEHNLMTLHDAFYEGQLVAFQPLILDITDLRELPLKGTSRDVPPVNTAGSSGKDGDSDGESQPNTARRRSASGADDWTDADDDEKESSKTDPAAEDDAALDLDALRGSGVVVGSTFVYRLPDGRIATDDEVRRRLVVLEEEVMLAHKIVRNMLTVLKDWMEPLLNSGARYIMPDDEVVSKLISADRVAREPYAKKPTALTSSGGTAGTGASSAAPAVGGGVSAVTAVANAVPKTTRQLWRQMMEHAVVDSGMEERMRSRGSKLLRSMESHICRHFLFLRQYVKRIRLKERHSNVNR